MAVTACKHWGRLPGLQPVRYPVLFFSLEMSRKQLTERVLCSEARVDSQRVRRGASLLEHEFRLLLDAGKRVAAAPLEIDDTAAPTILELQSRARRWRYRVLGPPPEDDSSEAEGRGLGLIMVDYLQLARGGKAKYSSREQEIADISGGSRRSPRI